MGFPPASGLLLLLQLQAGCIIWLVDADQELTCFNHGDGLLILDLNGKWCSGVNVIWRLAMKK
jgi:hypothetical protein